MIIEQMTPQEIEAELVADLPAIKDYMEELKIKFRRIVLKSKQYPACMHKLYTSKRRNKWILFLHAASKKELGDSTKIRYASYFNSDRGYYAVGITPKGMITYRPHFFSRYSERKGVDLHGVDLIAHYFRNNICLYTAYKEITLPDGSRQKSIVASTDEGIVLGIENPAHFILAKTFITRDMAKVNQVYNFPLLEAERKRLFDKELKSQPWG